MEGWIKLHRKFLEWEWFEDDYIVKLFVYLLLKANYEDKKWRGINVKRGQIITGLNKLSEDLNMSVKIIRNRLEKLEKTGEIGRQTGNQYSVITITNYDGYQIKDEVMGNQMGRQRASGGQAEGKQRATTKEVKKEKKERSIFRKPTVKQIRDYCKERKNNIDPQYFFDKNEGNGWVTGKNKIPIKNWQAVIRTWEKFAAQDKDKNSLDLINDRFIADD